MGEDAKLIKFYPNYVMKKNIYFIDHSMEIKPNHFNKDKPHLNKNGSNILSRKFQRYLIDKLPIIIQV